MDIESSSPSLAVTVAPVEQPSQQAIAARDPAPVQREPLSPAEARNEAVSNALFKAYALASTLVLSDEEQAALAAPFPDEAFRTGADGKENLIYIEHPHLRGRLNTVLGIGGWSIITRRTWAEEFRTQRNEAATRIYVEAVLLVHGCFVGEAVGDMVYYPNNAKQNYGDALEGAKTAAFRRCAKEFGVGLQAWDKAWCDGWMARHQGKAQVSGNYVPHTPPPPSRPAAPAPAPAVSHPNPAPVAPAPEKSLESAGKPMAFRDFNAMLDASKEKFLNVIAPLIEFANQYAHNAGLCLPNEGIADIPAMALFDSARQGVSKEEVSAAIVADYNRHMGEIKRLVDGANNADTPIGGEDQIPGAEMVSPITTVAPAAPSIPDNAQRRVIDVKAVSAKPGKTKAGKAYTRYGICDSSDTWYNTFDRTIGDRAIGMKGRRATVWFTVNQYGNNLEGIEAAE